MKFRRNRIINSEILQNVEKPSKSLIFEGFYFYVTPGGEMSNFLLEDYEAVLKFMNAETQKRDLKLK